MGDYVKWYMQGRGSAPPGWAVCVHQAQTTTGATPHLCLSHLACGANILTLKATGPGSELSACMNPQWFTSPPASEVS